MSSPLAAPSQVHALEPTDAFFGYTFSTRDSRHDDSRRFSVASDEVLPSYAETILPPYSPKAEPMTLAMYLFKFGFLFPPFWIMGAFIIFSPLRAPPPASDVSSAWLPEKTETERQQIITEMRRAELKWAKRCLWALIALSLIATTIGITAWAVMRA